MGLAGFVTRILQSLPFYTVKVDRKAAWEVAEGDLLPVLLEVRPGYERGHRLPILTHLEVFSS